MTAQFLQRFARFFVGMILTIIQFLCTFRQKKRVFMQNTRFFELAAFLYCQHGLVVQKSCHFSALFSQIKVILIYFYIQNVLLFIVP